MCFFTWNVSMASYLKLRVLVSSQVEGEDEKKSLKRFPTPRWILVRSNPQQLSNKDNKKWKLWSDTEMDPTHTNPKVQQQLTSKKQKCPSSQKNHFIYPSTLFSLSFMIIITLCCIFSPPIKKSRNLLQIQMLSFVDHSGRWHTTMTNANTIA